MICGFDLFKEGRYRYRFRYHCDEDPGLILQNGLTVVFLNTKGQDVTGAEPELIAFLRFIENSTAEEAHQSEDPRIQEMYRKINTLKNSEAVEADYMTAEEYKRRLQEEAEEKGKIRGETQGRIQAQLDMLQVVMRKFGKTADEAMDMLEIAPERRESYKEKLQERALQ